MRGKAVRRGRKQGARDGWAGVHDAGQLLEGAWVWLPGSRQGEEEVGGREAQEGTGPSRSRASRLPQGRGQIGLREEGGSWLDQWAGVGPADPVGEGSPQLPGSRIWGS